ncbi:MAG: HAMP domain-containing sensor histidine kinase [Anaerolineae bacterium]
MNTLRTRLIISHLLPTLVIIPLMGLALVYVLETQVLLVNVSRELVGQAILLAEMASQQGGIWHNSEQASVFVTRISPLLGVRIMLLDSRGYLLASSNADDAQAVGRPVEELPGLARALAGQTDVRVDYSQVLYAEVADVLVPVVGSDQQVMGVVRLTHQLAGIYERFLRLRYLILAVIVSGLVLGVAVGWVLALNMGRPLRQVTGAVYGIASGGQLAPLPERGPDEIRMLLHAVNTLVERLHGLEQARRQLLANLVHELGRPLGALRSAIQALLGGANQDEALSHELLVGMDEEISRLQRLLDDLARLHDQVLGSLELDRRPTSLPDWLPHVLAPWREAAQAKELHWQVTIPDGLPLIAVDPDRLAQTVSNLLSNAIEYTPAGGTVSVEVGQEDRALWIQVADTGPGIEAEEQARIFTPFYRGRSAGRFPQGMGLGLSIARDLVIAHGGELKVDSTPGQGSRFTIWLPLIPNQH